VKDADCFLCKGAMVIDHATAGKVACPDPDGVHAGVRSETPRASSGHEAKQAAAPAPGRPDMVNHPAHYGGADNPYEAIKVIDAWQLGFALGNAVKYIARAAHKGSELEDLKKARWYLDHKIEKLEEVRGYLCPFCKGTAFRGRANPEEIFCVCGATVKWSINNESAPVREAFEKAKK
jgi:uncharacterized protein DUF3310